MKLSNALWRVSSDLVAAMIHHIMQVKSVSLLRHPRRSFIPVGATIAIGILAPSVSAVYNVTLDLSLGTVKLRPSRLEFVAPWLILIYEENSTVFVQTFTVWLLWTHLMPPLKSLSSPMSVLLPQQAGGEETLSLGKRRKKNPLPANKKDQNCIIKLTFL